MFPLIEQKNSKPKRTHETVGEIVRGRPYEINSSVNKIDEVVRAMEASEPSRQGRMQRAATHQDLLRHTVDLEKKQQEIDNLKTVVEMAGGNEHAEAVVAAEQIDLMYKEIRREEETESLQPEAAKQSTDADAGLSKVAFDNELEINTDTDDKDSAQEGMLESAKEKLRRIYGEAA